MIRSIAILAALLFSVGAIAGHHAESVAVPGSDVRVHEANGVRYVSGGVGDTEQAAIERNFGDYALKVINVRAEPNGQAYVSDVKVWLGHANGEKILQTRTGGPGCSPTWRRASTSCAPGSRAKSSAAISASARPTVSACCCCGITRAKAASVTPIPQRRFGAAAAGPSPR